MIMPLTLAGNLLLLTKGEQIPASKLKHAIVKELIEEGIIAERIAGRTKMTLYVPDVAAFNNYLYHKFQIPDLEQFIVKSKDTESSRADLIEVSSDSKTLSRRTFKGFLVNSYLPIECTLSEQPFVVYPRVGTFQFVSNYEQFIPAAEVVIVGVENAEVFNHIRRISYLFKEMKPLFISRYPQEQSKDAIKWLLSIPNSYLHFGDFDFAGINIYLQEYKRHLNERAVFFVPDGLDVLIEKHGNKKLYDGQSLNDNAIAESAVKELVAMIHKHKKGLEQEALLIGH
jgi:hypothetical protein